jgi:hypothetical protein
MSARPSKADIDHLYLKAPLDIDWRTKAYPPRGFRLGCHIRPSKRRFLIGESP